MNYQTLIAVLVYDKENKRLLEKYVNISTDLLECYKASKERLLFIYKLNNKHFTNFDIYDIKTFKAIYNAMCSLYCLDTEFILDIKTLEDTTRVYNMREVIRHLYKLSNLTTDKLIN